MGKEKKVLPQAEVKKGICLEEWKMIVINMVANFVCGYYWEGMIAPAEITFSQDMFPYINDEADGEIYITKVNDKGVMQATYWGADIEKSGNIYVQHFKNVLSGLYEIEDDEEFGKAKEIFKIHATDPSVLIEAHNLLKLAVPDTDLFMYARNETTLHVVDLNQDPSFKRELKKKGLI